MLYPLSTRTRILQDLSGMWQFEMQDLKTTLAVPGSFNDQLALSEFKNYVGDFVYSRDFSLNEQLINERLFIRFGSATHFARVIINGKEVGTHKGGFTPFEFEITDYVVLGDNNLRVEMNNILDYTTLPVANYKEEIVDGKVVKKVDEIFDFFNYAGLNRKIYLWKKPTTFIQDIAISYNLRQDDSALVNFDVKVDGEYSNVEVEIYDEDKKSVGIIKGNNNLAIELNKVVRWQPLNSYLYTARVRVYKDDKLIDEYDEPFGMRNVEVKDCQFLINGKPFYFKGYGRHEDTYLNGRGLNEVANITDMNLMKWQGANSFRTSHYPYSEEMMRLADREGFVVIDETTAVGQMIGLDFSLVIDPNKKSTWEILDTKDAHEQVIKELIARDKNHACVCLWSIANEPICSDKGAYDYFKPLFDLARSLDPQGRPCTFVNCISKEIFNLESEVLPIVDIICINRYYGWYFSMSNWDEAARRLNTELEYLHSKYPDKPIMFTEYGADTVAGFHDIDINQAYTEEYQVKFYEVNHKVIDSKPYFVGEHVWNFADFQTKYGMFRVQGNRKGLFTRERKPKAAAMYFYNRWNKMPNFIDKKNK